MTVEKFLEDEFDGYKLCKRIPNSRMKKLLNRYKSVDCYTYYYDSEEHPDIAQWVDVEGIGYGWLWLGSPKSRNGQRKRVVSYAMSWYSCCRGDYYKKTLDGVTVIVFQFDPETICVVRMANDNLYFR